MANISTWWSDPLYKPAKIEESDRSVKIEEPETTRQSEIADNKIQITASINGTVLANYISEQAEKILVDELKAQAKKILFTRYYSRGYSSSDPGRMDLTEWIRDEIKEIFRENREEIIKAAARELADSMRRSKPVRERFCDELGEELDK